MMQFKTISFWSGFAILGMVALAVAGKKTTSDLDSKVAQLLTQMTVEEKVGQMTQISLEVVSKDGPVNLKEPHELDLPRLRDAIIKHKVGSILNVATSSHSVDHWHEIITSIQDVATKETRLKIPILYGIDAIHGATYTKDATLFPQAIGMAATWNPELMKKNGEITAYEVRACGIPWNFNPVLDMGRQPLWPRLWETFGEDPYLASTLAAAYIKGLEGEDNDISKADKVASCMKHYLGYSFPLTGKDRTPAWIPDRQLFEIFVPPFKSAIDAGAHTIMINSAHINGIPVHASHYYLTELLQKELGFNGLIVSDWRDIINLYDRDHVVASNKEAVRLAVMAGIDMSMVPTDYSFYDLLIELVKEGQVPMQRIDEAVGRILRLKYELGLFDNPYPNKTLKPKFASTEFQAVNLQAAHESITLLKNTDQLLPLSKKTKVLVTGPTATKLAPLNSGWTITWQGNREDLYPKNKLTILQAIEQKIGKENVTYVPGAGFSEAVDVDAAVLAAKKADVAILCLGEDAYCETPGNISDLTLPEAQLQLAEAVAKTGTPVVLVMTEGRPRLIRRIEGDARAILMAYLPGMEGGVAIADVLFGDFNPCGKLPVTYPRYPNDLTLYDHTYSENSNPDCRYNPQWPFGFGLSYTTFEYSDLKLDKKSIKKGESIKCQVTVKNSGKIAGKEVVQLYLSDLVASVIPPTKRLKGFSKISLEPGQSQTVTFVLTEKDLSFIGMDNRPTVEPGEFKVTIGLLSQSFTVN